MKKYGFYLFLLFFNLTIVTSYSQVDNKINAFLTKMEKNLTEVGSTARITDYKTCSNNRKIKIYGTTGKNRPLSFVKSIKYYKGGLKKEKTKIYEGSYNKKNVIMDYVKINDRVYYLKYYETERDSRNIIVKISEEVLIDNSLYRKIIRDETGTTVKMENSVNLDLNK